MVARGRQSQEFKASMVNRMGSRIARETLSQKKKQKTKNKNNKTIIGMSATQTAPPIVPSMPIFWDPALL